ncbi:MAG: hypothetical protein MRZ79_05715 [Bacteroidia bacterium]|nr:hypothetical protein [Bacteroidia bacterium]
MIRFLVLLLAALTNIGIAQNNSVHGHDFDFWLGKWDVFKFNTDTLVGKSHIESIIDSVALLENYHSVKSTFKGKSINKYDKALGVWDQFWVDNSGLTLRIQGNLTEGAMVMGNENNKITWKPLAGDRVRQTWEIKNQKDGKWKTVFDGEYRRRKE